MAHTPAPWTANRYRVKAENFEFLQTSCVGAKHEVWEANAKLIAAAPELLAALINAKGTLVTLAAAHEPHLLNDEGSNWHVLQQVIAAIAKAGAA